MAVTVRVRGFLPSTNGFGFANDFAPGPVLRIAGVPVGNAARGLCGGMVFAVEDYFLAGRAPSPGTAAPASGTPLFRFLVRRLFDSYHLPVGPLRYYLLMSPLMPVGARRARLVRREWPAVRADLDAGRLCPLGLVKVRSANPARLGQNHQVLAYGYDLDETLLRLAVYDPNAPGDDTAALTVDLGGVGAPADQGVRTLFRVGYRPTRRPLP